MLKVPFNQSFTVTPSFKATFSLESPNYEEWDLHWDETYGFNAAKGICILQVKSAEKCNDFLHSLAAHFLFYLVI